MAKSTRLIFTFHEKSLERLRKMAAKKGMSMAATVRESLVQYEGLQQQAKEGFTEVIVRNPRTGKERVMVW
jgi:hypothetical protein